MESNTQYQPTINEPQQPSAPHSRKKLFILLAALAVVLVAAILFAVFHKKSNSGNNNVDTSDTSLYFNRAGYDRSKLRSDVGDPMAIKLTPQREAQSLTSGTVIIPACSVLTPDNLTSAGFKLYPNGFGYPVIQNYLSETGKARFAPDPNNMPLSSDTISCDYGLMSDKRDLQSVNIAVHQPFTVTQDVTTNYLSQRGYMPQADVNGYKVFKRDAKSETDRGGYMLQKDGNSIELRLALDDANKGSELVKVATANLEKLKTKPQGVSDISYDSPTFTQKIAHACDLITNDNVKQLSGADASPLVKEFWSTAVGVADFSSVGDYKTKTNYLRNQCIHTSNDPAYVTLVGTKNHTLETKVTNYENDQAASNGLKYISAGQGNDTMQKVSGVADEAYAYTKDQQNILAIRQGRFVVELTYDFAKQSGAFADLGSYSQKLTPIAQQVAAKLKAL